jgi:hypothetical protein
VEIIQEQGLNKEFVNPYFDIMANLKYVNNI